MIFVIWQIETNQEEAKGAGQGDRGKGREGDRGKVSKAKGRRKMTYLRTYVNFKARQKQFRL